MPSTTPPPTKTLQPHLAATVQQILQSAAALHFAAVAGRRVTSVALANSDQPDLGLQITLAMVELLAGPHR